MISLYLTLAQLKNYNTDIDELVKSVSRYLETELPPKITREELHQKLSVYINDLIVHDFQKLVFILYRVDVHEGKLKHLLKENPGEDAGLVIADLIIERQLQKIKSRGQFGRRDNDIDENEKW